MFKIQIPMKPKNPRIGLEGVKLIGPLEFGYCNLFGIWRLEFGISPLVFQEEIQFPQSCSTEQERERGFL
jgi:hypothetical protein